MLFFFLAVDLTGQNTMDLGKSANITFEPKALRVLREPSQRYSGHRVVYDACSISLIYADQGGQRRSGRGIAEEIADTARLVTHLQQFFHSHFPIAPLGQTRREQFPWGSVFAELWKNTLPGL